MMHDETVLFISVPGFARNVMCVKKESQEYG
jgi:hypothetical protein